MVPSFFGFLGKIFENTKFLLTPSRNSATGISAKSGNTVVRKNTLEEASTLSALPLDAR